MKRIVYSEKIEGYYDYHMEVPDDMTDGEIIEMCKNYEFDDYLFDCDVDYDSLNFPCEKEIIISEWDNNREIYSE